MYWMLSLFQCRWCYHFLWGKCYPFWSLGCYHFRVLRMLSFYGLNVIIFFPGMLSFSEPANVIIFVLSFFLVQILCYHLCYHLMLSFIVIISPLFSFSWKRDTLKTLQVVDVVVTGMRILACIYSLHEEDDSHIHDWNLPGQESSCGSFFNSDSGY